MTEQKSAANRTGYGASRRNGNGLAIAGLVCGIVGVLFLPIILGPLALIFGGVAWSRANRGAQHKGMAIAAVVLGVVDLIIFAVLVALAATHGGSWYVNFG